MESKVAYYRIDKKFADFLAKVNEKYHIVGIDWSGGLNLGFVVEDKDPLNNWGWSYLRSSDGPEYECPHGIGHSQGVHGCDGCCGHSSFKQRIKNNRRKK